MVKCGNDMFSSCIREILGIRLKKLKISAFMYFKFLLEI